MSFIGESLISQELFKTVKSLGVGATAEVFWAINLKDDKNVALKVFNPVVYQDHEALGRLKREVESLEKLRHPNVVSLLGEHVQEKFYALELELVEGSDLRVWQKNNESKLIEDRLWILAQVARGLGAAHELEILHRDLKPENVLISDFGEVKITDFGLARQLDRLTMTRIGLLTGSLGYMAPEIINGGKATSRSDIFSFGVLAYELLAGSSPFIGETPQALLKAVVEQREISIKEKNTLVPVRIATLIESCLQKNPEMRPESIWTIESEILGCLSATRLLPHCKNMICQKTKNTSFAAALSIKYKTLQSEVQALEKHTTPMARERLLEVAQELMILFPEDKSYSGILESLNPKKSSRRSLLVCLLILCMAYAASNYYWRETPRLVPAVKIPEVALLKPSASIKFFADTDVRIYVDGKLVPSRFWPSFNTLPGVHRVKLVKAGFVPIENKVEVLPGKVVTINTQGRLD